MFFGPYHIFPEETLGGRVVFSTTLNRSKMVLEKVMGGKCDSRNTGDRQTHHDSQDFDLALEIANFPKLQKTIENY